MPMWSFPMAYVLVFQSNGMELQHTENLFQHSGDILCLCDGQFCGSSFVSIWIRCSGRVPIK